jgi:hypothetical protein
MFSWKNVEYIKRVITFFKTIVNLVGSWLVHVSIWLQMNWLFFFLIHAFWCVHDAIWRDHPSPILEFLHTFIVPIKKKIGNEPNALHYKIYHDPL